MTLGQSEPVSLTKSHAEAMKASTGDSHHVSPLKTDSAYYLCVFCFSEEMLMVVLVILDTKQLSL